MARERNWLPLLGLLLGIVAIVSYFTFVNAVVAPRVPLLRDYPIANVLLLALALWISFAGVRRAFGQPERYRGKILAPVLAGLNVLFAAFFGWYIVGYSSNLPTARDAPPVGRVAPDFTLMDHEEKPVHLADLRGKNVLLVFYRGHW